MIKLLRKKIKKNILILGPNPPPMGGVATYISQVFNAVAPANCFWYGYGNEPCDSTSLQVTQQKHFDPGLKALRNKGGIVAFDSSSVFLEYLDTKLLWRWLIAILLKRIRWIKVIHDVNLPVNFSAYSKKEKRLIRFSSRFVWRYVVVNNALADWLTHEISAREKIITIPSLICSSTLLVETKVPVQFEQLQSNTDFIVSAVGAMNAFYGFDHVVASVKQLESDLKCKIGLVFLSTDFAQDSDYVARLHDKKNRICILKNLPHSSVLGVFKRSSVVVRSVKQESYGLSKVEAIIQGTPVVATRTGETRGMLVYEFGDIVNLTAMLKFALTTDLHEKIRYWAQLYTREADDNRSKLLELLKLAGADLC